MLMSVNTSRNYHDGTLEGFRERPEKGNGFVPHTYTRNGKYISCSEAKRIINADSKVLVYWKKRGITDIDEIARRESERRSNRQRGFLRETDDGRMVTAAQFAKEQGVTYHTVISYLRHHDFSLKGFANRGHSRVNPKKYPHTALGVAKTAREWSQHFDISIDIVKNWLWKHGNQMDGFETRPTKCIQVLFRGKVRTFAEIAKMLHGTVSQVRCYYYNHGNTFKGFNPKRGRGRIKGTCKKKTA